MAMDGIALGAVIYECQSLVGGKIDKVQQPEKDLLLFAVRANNGNQKMLISIHPENGRIQLTNRTYDNPMNAPAFCMLLRRRLVGGRICSIRQIGADRVCEIIILARNELFDEVSLRLIIELTGKHANLVLLEPNGAIVDCLRRVSASNDGARILLPGFPYEAIPTQNKLDPFTAPAAEYDKVLQAPDPIRAMTAAFDGVSKQTAVTLLSAAQTGKTLYALMQAMKGGSYAPCVAFDAEGAPVAALPIQPSEMYHRVDPADTMSAALDRYYVDRDQIVRIRRHGSALRHTVSTALSRAQNKYAAFLETIQQSSAQETARISGELILANLHLAKPGQSELIVDDYFVDPPAKRAITLDPAFIAGKRETLFQTISKGQVGQSVCRRADRWTRERDCLSRRAA